LVKKWGRNLLPEIQIVLLGAAVSETALQHSGVAFCHGEVSEKRDKERKKEKQE